MLRLSYSQIQSWRQCPQQYFYRYVAGLARKEAAPPLELGSLLHQYLETYYKGLRNCEQAEEAHMQALAQTLDEWEPKLIELANLAYATGADDEVVGELQNTATTGRYLMERYYAVRGKTDADAWNILLVEEPLLVRLGRGIEAYGIVDLVARENSSGLLHIFEHKTTRNIPGTGYRLRDFQTVLYANMLRAINGMEIKGTLWNYIRTKAPETPERLKSGEFTRRNIDSTWDVYRQTIEAAGEDVSNYLDMCEKLERKEVENYFPRYSYLLLGDPGILLRDFVASGLEIQRARAAWKRGREIPIRNISRSCDWCFANKLCSAAIALGGEDEMRRTYYTTREQRKQQEFVEIR